MIQAPVAIPPPPVDLNCVLSQAGEALGEQIRARARRRWGGEAEPLDDRRVAEREEQIAHLNGQLSELAERLDFAERRERKLSAGQ